MTGRLVREWTNPYNSFNSFKGLLYADWYKSIREWQDGHRLSPLPPIEASIDPIHNCNLSCNHCNAGRYLKDHKYNYKMDSEHLADLIYFLGHWGVKGICFAGGGEPTLHPDLYSAIKLTQIMGMESSVITNGTIFINKIASLCRWIGISVDAATPETYLKGKGRDLFKKVIDNILSYVNTSKNCDIAFKFLIFDYNEHEIYEACRLAKQLGVKDFHARPADFHHQGMEDKTNNGSYHIDIVKNQFEKCHELEDENFHVYTVVHKFDIDLKPRKDFSQCYASPCCMQLCADGGIYLCPDQRFQEAYKIGDHNDLNGIRDAWGSKKHYDLVFKTGKANCTTRCTFAPYNKQCEELYIKGNDPFCWRFV